MSHTVDVDCNFSIRQNCATLYTTDIVYFRTNMTKLRPGHLNYGNYSGGHRGHDVQEGCSWYKDSSNVSCDNNGVTFLSQFKKILFRDLRPSFFQVCFLKILSTNRIEIRSYNTTRFLRSTRNIPKNNFIRIENQPKDQYAEAVTLSI